MSGGGSIEEEIGKKKSRSRQNLFFPRTTIRSLSSLFDDDRYLRALLSLTKNGIVILILRTNKRTHTQREVVVFAAIFASFFSENLSLNNSIIRYSFSLFC